MMLQTIIHTCKKCKVGVKTPKNNGDAQMVIFLKIKEMSYLVIGLFYNLMRPPFVFISINLNSLGALFALIPP